MGRKGEPPQTRARWQWEGMSAGTTVSLTPISSRVLCCSLAPRDYCERDSLERESSGITSDWALRHYFEQSTPKTRNKSWRLPSLLDNWYFVGLLISVQRCCVSPDGDFVENTCSLLTSAPGHRELLRSLWLIHDPLEWAVYKNGFNRTPVAKGFVLLPKIKSFVSKFAMFSIQLETVGIL